MGSPETIDFLKTPPRQSCLVRGTIPRPPERNHGHYKRVQNTQRSGRHGPQNLQKKNKILMADTCMLSLRPVDFKPNYKFWARSYFGSISKVLSMPETIDFLQTAYSNSPGNHFCSGV